MQRRTLAAALAAAPLYGCAVRAQAPDTMVMDDGSMPLTPAYLVTYTQGKPTAFVRADFFTSGLAVEVALDVGGFVKVNGVTLRRDPKETISYIGDIPPARSFTFECQRSPSLVTRHTFDLPPLEIVSKDPYYVPEGVFRVNVGPRDATPRGVIEDNTNMTIRGPRGETRFTSRDSPEVVDRTFVLRQISDLPAGNSYPARIYRQQRVSLKDMSDSPSGWGILSHGIEFMLANR